MTDAIIIRPMARFDLAQIEVLFHHAYKTETWELPPYDPGHCWVQMIEQARQGLVFVAEEAGKIVGILALHVATWPWNPHVKHLENIHFFVDPEHRQNGVAGKLLDVAETISTTSGMKFRLTATFGTEPELLERWCKIRGYKVLGNNFLWNVK